MCSPEGACVNHGAAPSDLNLPTRWRICAPWFNSKGTVIVLVSVLAPSQCCRLVLPPTENYTIIHPWGRGGAPHQGGARRPQSPWALESTARRLGRRNACRSPWRSWLDRRSVCQRSRVLAWVGPRSGKSGYNLFIYSGVKIGDILDTLCSGEKERASLSHCRLECIVTLRATVLDTYLDLPSTFSRFIFNFFLISLISVGP